RRGLADHARSPDRLSTRAGRLLLSKPRTGRARVRGGDSPGKGQATGKWSACGERREIEISELMKGSSNALFGKTLKTRNANKDRHRSRRNGDDRDARCANRRDDNLSITEAQRPVKAIGLSMVLQQNPA